MPAERERLHLFPHGVYLAIAAWRVILVSWYRDERVLERRGRVCRRAWNPRSEKELLLVGMCTSIHAGHFTFEVFSILK